MSEPQVAKDTVLTIPNVLSFLRLAGIPLFVWLLLGPHADLWALGILVFSAVSDWADGVLARRLNQVSTLGRLLDPLADRLYILATLLTFVVRDIVPLWLALAIVGRDVLLLITLPLLRHYGYSPLQVNMVGKAATLCLLAAFPGLLFAQAAGPHWIEALGDVVTPIAWAFAWWGVGLYWLAGWLYARQTSTLIAAARRQARVAA